MSKQYRVTFMPLKDLPEKRDSNFVSLDSPADLSEFILEGFVSLLRMDMIPENFAIVVTLEDK